jgi:phosphopantetheinyl transferase
MPLLLSKKIDPYSAYAAWHITETEEQLSTLLNEPTQHSNPNKKSEWIVTRILIKYLCHLFDLPFHGIASLPSGKPILVDHQAQISISHSFPVAACLINLRRSCGIDIEMPRTQLTRVKRKFLREDESFGDDLETLCKYWSAKEVLIKVHGDKQLALKDHLKVEIHNESEAEGLILKEGFESGYQIRFEKLFNYIIAYSI